jgi:hypothetical protein
MIQMAPHDPGSLKEAKLPRLDWVLLPVLSLLTIVLLASSTELMARRMFPELDTGMGACVEHNVALLGVRAIPNTACWGKAPESPLVQYKFNSCGHPAGMECGPKPSGVFRIVLTGSFVAVGKFVKRENSLAGLLPTELSRKTGRKVELYNEGTWIGTAHTVALRFNEVLAAELTLVLWMVTPLDITNTTSLPSQSKAVAMPEPSGEGGSLARAWYLLKSAYRSNSIPELIQVHFDRTRSALLLRHFLFESQNQYVKSFLIGEDAEFLRAEPTADWQGRLYRFDSYVGGIAERAKAAGAPLAVVFMPNRAQAAMISMGEWPEGYDPYRLDNELRSIVTSHGGIYPDILPGFRKIPNPEQYYFPVDGHPNADGHAIISGLLAKVLTSGAVPALSVDSRPRDISIEKGN